METEIFATLEELNIGLVAFSPLGRGFLTGKVNRDTLSKENDNRAELPRFTNEAMRANQVVLNLLQNIADQKNVTMAQVALGWVLAQRNWIIPIPGTTRIDRLSENNAAGNVHFSDEELLSINEAVDQMNIVGDRYTPSEEARIGR